MARATRPVPDDPAEAAEAAYAHGLRLLSGRELAEADVHTRLTRRGFDATATASAIARLAAVGALSDQRAVRAVARTLVRVKRRGRIRARRELEARGFRTEDVAAALAELFAEVGEGELIERVLDARLRARPLTKGDAGGLRRAYAALIRRGFSPAASAAAVRRRAAGEDLGDALGHDESGS